MSKFRRSLVITFFSSTGATVAQFLVSLALARILSPSEIGVFSITVVFVNIAHIFRDFGVTTYLQREATLTPEKISASIGVLFTTSWMIAIALFSISGWIALWFKEPSIAPVMRVLALGFVFIPFGAITHALLVRDFSADKEAIVNVAGTLSYTSTCLGLAWLGHGTMSLAWANLANIVVCAIALFRYRPKDIPWMPSFRNWGSIVHFGLGALISNSASAINNSIPDLMLGKLSGARQVGLLSRAGSTVAIFSYIAGATVNYGALSYVSQSYNRGESLKPILNKAVALLTGIGWPILAVTVVLANQIVTALYGAKWLECVEAIPALAVAMAIGLLFNYVPIALTALGRPYLSAVPTVVTIIIRIVFGLLLFNGSLKSFAEAICIGTIAAAPIMAFQQWRYLDYHFKDMLIAVFPSAVVAIVCLLAALGMRAIMPPSIHALASVLIAAVPITIVWYLTLRLTRHSLVIELHHVSVGILHRLRRLISRAN